MASIFQSANDFEENKSRSTIKDIRSDNYTEEELKKIFSYEAII